MEALSRMPEGLWWLIGAVVSLYFGGRYQARAQEFEREVIVERVRAGLANARAKGKRLGRPVRDPGARERVVALKGEGLSLRQIAVRERLSPSGVRKMLKQAGVETAAVPAPASVQA